MIANPVGLILLIGLGLCLAVLLVISLFSRRLAGIGLLLLIGWIALEPAYLRVKYWAEMSWRGYDHYIDNGRAHFGVILPKDDGLFRRPLGYTDNPYRGLRLVARLPGDQAEMAFSVTETIPVDPLPDISDCRSETTVAGLLAFAEDTCPALSWNRTATVYVTPPNSPVFAMFTLRDSVADPFQRTHIRAATLWHGPFRMNGTLTNAPIDDWRTTLAHLTAILDTSFTALPQD